MPTAGITLTEFSSTFEMLLSWVDFLLAKWFPVPSKSSFLFPSIQSPIDDANDFLHLIVGDIFLKFPNPVDTFLVLRLAVADPNKCYYNITDMMLVAL